MIKNSQLQKFNLYIEKNLFEIKPKLKFNKIVINLNVQI